MSKPETSRTTSLARHVADFPIEEIPAAVFHSAKRSLLDGLGASLAASSLGTSARPFVAMAREGSVAHGTPVLGHGFRAVPSLAAMANGALAHALDFEDTHDAAIVHPYAAAMPAAMSALAGAGQVSGREFLAAIIHGANLVCRVSLGFKNSAEAGGWFLHPILNTFAASAAACRVLGASSRETENAFSLAFNQSTSSAAAKTEPASDYRAIRDAFNAHAGYVSASLARAGVVGFSGVFDPPFGIYDLYGDGDGDVDETALLGDLATRWENLEVSYKPWPSCRGTHAFVDCALQLMEPGFDAARIADVEIRVSPFYQALCEPISAKSRPQTAPDAKFSIPFVLATTLLQGKLTLGQFDEAALRDEATAGLAERIRVTTDHRLDLRTAMNGGVKVTMSDGVTLEANVEEPQGSPRNPMSDSALIEKFRDCAALAEHPPRSLDEIVDLVMGLEQSGDARALLEALAP